MIIGEFVFSLFLHTFCLFSYFFRIFVPRLSPERDARDKNLSPEDNESHLSLK